jgi:hypothetical protein
MFLKGILNFCWGTPRLIPRGITEQPVSACLSYFKHSIMGFSRRPMTITRISFTSLGEIRVCSSTSSFSVFLRCFSVSSLLDFLYASWMLRKETMLYYCLPAGAFKTIMNSFSALGDILRVMLLHNSFETGFSINQQFISTSEFGSTCPSL